MRHSFRRPGAIGWRRRKCELGRIPRPCAVPQGRFYTSSATAGRANTASPIDPTPRANHCRPGQDCKPHGNNRGTAFHQRGELEGTYLLGLPGLRVRDHHDAPAAGGSGHGAGPRGLARRRSNCTAAVECKRGSITGYHNRRRYASPRGVPEGPMEVASKAASSITLSARRPACESRSRLSDRGAY